MIKLLKILHPTDFSDFSNEALKYACALAGHFGAELHLIHVIGDPTTVVAHPIGGYLPPNFYQDLKQRSDETLLELPDKEWAKEKVIIRTTIEGTPFLEIIRYARENSIDMIVMGTHGYSGLVHMMMGSVSEKVVRKAHCPVLTVHPEDHNFVMP